ncbi:MAG TPA: hypothetical protein VKV15_01655 [Bryobacteraceae bacterium]|nr:hypothetical protein [Bryobacteraceae bacterium]
MPKCALILLLAVTSAFGAEKLTAPQLMELARSNPAELPEAIRASFAAKQLKDDTAWEGRGAEFFFAVESTAKPVLFIDDARGPEMQPLDRTDLWYASAQVSQLGSTTRSMARYSAAVMTCRLSDRFHTCSQASQPAHCWKSLSIPAKSMTG